SSPSGASTSPCMVLSESWRGWQPWRSSGGRPLSSPRARSLLLGTASSLGELPSRLNRFPAKEVSALGSTSPTSPRWPTSPPWLGLAILVCDGSRRRQYHFPVSRLLKEIAPASRFTLSIVRLAIPLSLARS